MLLNSCGYMGLGLEEIDSHEVTCGLGWRKGGWAIFRPSTLSNLKKKSSHILFIYIAFSFDFHEGPNTVSRCCK